MHPNLAWPVVGALPPPSRASQHRTAWHQGIKEANCNTALTCTDSSPHQKLTTARQLFFWLPFFAPLPF